MSINSCAALMMSILISIFRIDFVAIQNDDFVVISVMNLSA